MAHLQSRASVEMTLELSMRFEPRNSNSLVLSQPKAVQCAGECFSTPNAAAICAPVEARLLSRRFTQPLTHCEDTMVYGFCVLPLHRHPRSSFLTHYGMSSNHGSVEALGWTTFLFPSGSGGMQMRPRAVFALSGLHHPHISFIAPSSITAGPELPRRREKEVKEKYELVA